VSLKDAATRTAVLSALADLIDGELEAAKAELKAELKAAKERTGTQQIGVSLPDGSDIGKATLVQPKAVAAITDPEKFAAWVVSLGERFKSEFERKFVISVKPAFQKKLLNEITAAGVAKWCDQETGELHDVPGVQMQGRAAYTRLTVPDEGKAAIAEAWCAGRLAHLVLPQLTAGSGE
jgi:hypothetical protein